jgi:hypothetical protein
VDDAGRHVVGELAARLSTIPLDLPALGAAVLELEPR